MDINRENILAKLENQEEILTVNLHTMLILLDIDGVMLQAKPWSSPPLLEDGFVMFSSKSVEALNKIVENSGADILLTTSHKHQYTLDEWREILTSRGVNVNGLDRLPFNSDRLNRKEEISNWFMMDKSVRDFVIIDDDRSLNDLEPYLKTRLVLTSPLIGLTSLHVEQALDILETPLELI